MWSSRDSLFSQRIRVVPLVTGTSRGYFPDTIEPPHPLYQSDDRSLHEPFVRVEFRNECVTVGMALLTVLRNVLITLRSP